jgi:hypothetical protein
MTIKELKEILSGFDEETEVAIVQDDDFINIENWYYGDTLKTLFLEAEEEE